MQKVMEDCWDVDSAQYFAERELDYWNSWLQEPQESEWHLWLDGFHDSDWLYFIDAMPKDERMDLLIERVHKRIEILVGRMCKLRSMNSEDNNPYYNFFNQAEA